MKLRTFAAACLLTLCAAAGVAAQPTPTPERPGPLQLPSTLVCRMGSGMVHTFQAQFEVMQTQLNGQNVRVPVLVAISELVRFARGGEPAKADATNVKPGFCGLTNRAMTASDPDAVFYLGHDSFTIADSKIWGNQGVVDRTEMVGGVLEFNTNQAFSVQVTRPPGTNWRVVAGTKPTLIK